MLGRPSQSSRVSLDRASSRPNVRPDTNQLHSSAQACAIGKSKQRIKLESSPQSLPALPTRRCFPYEDRARHMGPDPRPEGRGLFDCATCAIPVSEIVLDKGAHRRPFRPKRPQNALRPSGPRPKGRGPLSPF